MTTAGACLCGDPSCPACGAYYDEPPEPVDPLELACRRQGCGAEPGEPCEGNGRGYVHGERFGDACRETEDRNREYWEGS